MHPLIQLFGIQAPTYTVLMSVGFGMAGVSALFVRRRHGISAVDAVLTVVLFAIGGIVGARLLYILAHLKESLAAGNLLGAIARGGTMYFGGLIGGVVTFVLSARRARIPFLTLADTMVPCGALAHAISRVGCFMAGCCYGCPTSSFLGVVFPAGGSAPAGVRLLPVQLFEAAFLLLLAAALTVLLWRFKRRGMNAAVYLMAYGAWRFFIEFFRADPRGTLLGLRTPQAVSLAMLLGGALFWVYVKKTGIREDVGGVHR